MQAAGWRTHAAPATVQASADLSTQASEGLKPPDFQPGCSQVRRDAGDTSSLTLERPARVLASPVSSRLESRSGGRRVGVIRLTSFNARAHRDVAAVLRKLEEQGAEEFELDLRDNRWGGGCMFGVAWFRGWKARRGRGGRRKVGVRRRRAEV